jgi:sialic acid synthase SpsE
MFEHLKTKPYLIAEIGINHNGSVKNAKKLIDLAKKYNFDAVKFQKRNPEISTPDYQKNLMRETPWGLLTYLEYKKKIEFSESDYLEINNYLSYSRIKYFQLFPR